ncbi:MAG: S-formylglutathione hydrolase [Kofleriaceae bacterium]
MADAIETVSEQRAFGGTQGFYRHASAACGGPMKFSVFLPPGASPSTPAPALYYLAGLTCTEETFPAKAGAQRLAAELGLALVACDTSPRSARYPGDDASWDFGVGAGFYLDATAAPWSATYRMRTYVVDELRRAVEGNLPVARDRRGIMGHSMGGHGALTIALTAGDAYASCSALAPICAPSEVPWGEKAFAGYLGGDRAAWRAHDAVALIEDGARFAGELLVDQGTADKFLERELRPERLEAACAAAGQPLRLRRHDGYDHSYYFIATVVDEHLRHHARALAPR